MNKNLTLSGLLLFLCPVAALAASACQQVAAGDAFKALIGHWQTTADAKGRYVTEQWQLLDPHNYAGQGSQVAANERSSSEDLRLVQMGGQWFYLAKVAGNNLPVAFALTQCQLNDWLFDNPQHDFPKQLHYRLVKPDELTVTVSDGAGQGFTLKYRRLR